MSAPTLQMYGSKNMPTWCPGCGDFGIWMAIKQALVNLNIFPYEVLFVFDVGCSGNMSDKIGGYVYHSLHGRAIPLATGASVSNRKVKVIAFGGDGGTYGEGINHLIHAVRCDYDITMIVHNNGNYGLTTGQATPTSCQGTKLLASPFGVIESPIDPIDLLFSLGGSFIARGFSSDVPNLVKIFEAALTHKGFSHIDVIQACPTYDKARTFETYQENERKLSGDYDVHDAVAAREYYHKHQSEVLSGVLYQDLQNIDFYSRMHSRKGIETELKDEVIHYPIDHFLQKLR